MSNQIPTIPVIDISALYSDNAADWYTVDQAIGTVCVESGAFMAMGIPQPVRPDSEQTESCLMRFLHLQP